MRIVYTIAMLYIAMCSLKAQYHENLMFGLKIGTDYSLMTNITNTLVNDENKPMYEFSEKSTYLPAVSVLTNYRFDNTQVAVEGRISYYQIANNVEKQSLVTSAFETYNLRYQYLAIGLFTKVYLYRGFYFGAGANFGSCLNGSSGIEYISSTATVAQNLQSQEHIRQALKGRANITAGAIMGYEFKFGLSLEAAYYYGLTDMVETIVNPYNFAESNNNSRSLQFTLGWAISKEGFYF